MENNYINMYKYRQPYSVHVYKLKGAYKAHKWSQNCILLYPVYLIHIFTNTCCNKAYLTLEQPYNYVQL